MNIEDYRNYCLQKQGIEEVFPFDTKTLVYKVHGKMFALTDIDTFQYITLKCAPAMALQYREQYKDVTPGYHMNKKHWNTIIMRGNIPDQIIYQWIDDSYRLVVK